MVSRKHTTIRFCPGISRKENLLLLCLLCLAVAHYPLSSLMPTSSV